MRITFLVFFILVLASSFALTASQPFYQICGSSGNFTANSTYDSNLSTLLANITATAVSPSSSGFASSEYGSLPDVVSALGLCRGDSTNSSTCGPCLSTAIRDARNLCPYTRDATIYYDRCLLRYSNQFFLSNPADNSAIVYGSNVNNITVDSDRFNKLVYILMNATADKAANLKSKYATGEANFSAEFPKVHGMAQCTPDLTSEICRSCLQGLIGSFHSFSFDDKQGARILGVRCTVRYEVYPFFDGNALLQITMPLASPPSSPPPQSYSPPAKGGKTSAGKVLAIIIPIVVVSLVAICICLVMRRKYAKLLHQAETNEDEIHTSESLLFTISTLRAATGNFDEANIIGKGGFGVVFKGALRNGHEIAVKRLSKNSNQGVIELKNELVLVANLQHRNLVRILGACVEGGEKLLVYEYVPNSSLDRMLFGGDKTRLDWRTRQKIIYGIARGLQYLHEDSQLKIIHRDLKPSNILLDADMNPKISDFGIARLFGSDQTQDITNRVVGTTGYWAPEYAMRGIYSIKSDVFSFGVIVLEILTGRKNTDVHDSDLLSSIWEQWTMGTALNLIDPQMVNNCQRSEVLRCFHIGLLCVQDNPAERPKMSEVTVMLSGETVSVATPSRPALCFRDSATYENSTDQTGNENETQDRSLMKSVPLSSNEVSITNLEPR